MRQTYVSGACPSVEDMFAFLDGESDPESQVEFLRHIAACEACRLALADMVSTLSRVAETLRSPSQDELPDAAAWDAASDSIIGDLEDSGLVRLKKRMQAKDIALRLGRGTVKGAQVVGTSLWRGTRAAYSGAVAVSRFAAQANEAASRITQRSPWRFAW